MKRILRIFALAAALIASFVTPAFASEIGDAADKAEYSNLFVCLMGICTVFIGLICIIVLVSVMSGIVRKTDKAAEKKAAPAGQSPSSAQAPAAQNSALTGETVAAISAVIAEEMGTDVSAIRIVSLKKVQA